MKTDLRRSRPFISTSFFAVAGRVPGLLIPFIIARQFGAGEGTDAFFFAYAVIFAMVGLFSQIFESSLVPVLSVRRRDMHAVSSLTNGAMMFSFPLLLIASFVAGLFIWLVLVSPAASGPEARMPLAMFLALLPLLFFHTGISAMHGVLFMQNRFWFAAASPVIRSLVVILSIYCLQPILGVASLPAGFALGESLRFIATFVLFRTVSGWKAEFDARRTLPVLRKFFSESVLFLASLAAINMMFVADQAIAAHLGKGDLTLLSYADRLLQIGYLVFVAAILPVFLSDWSRIHAESPERFGTKIAADSLKVFVFSLAVVIPVYLLRDPIVDLVYAGGALADGGREMVADVFGWYCLGFVPGVLQLMLTRCFIVIRAFRFLAVFAWAQLAVNVGANLVFVSFMGLPGIAAATAVVYTTAAMVMSCFFLACCRRRAA